MPKAKLLTHCCGWLCVCLSVVCVWGGGGGTCTCRCTHAHARTAGRWVSGKTAPRRIAAGGAAADQEGGGTWVAAIELGLMKGRATQTSCCTPTPTQRQATGAGSMQRRQAGHTTRPCALGRTPCNALLPALQNYYKIRNPTTAGARLSITSAHKPASHSSCLMWAI